MLARAAVILTVVTVCLGNSVDDARAADVQRAQVLLTFSIHDPWRDTMGTPVCPDGLPMTFALFKSDSDVEPVWEEYLDCVPVDESNYVRVLLGETSALSSDVVTTYDALYLEVTIKDDVIKPRIFVVFSDYVMPMSVSGSAGTVAGEPVSDSGSTLVYSAGQRSFGAVGVGSDPHRPRIVVFGDGPRPRVGKLTQSEILTQTGRQLLEQQRTIATLRLEIAKLRDASPVEE